MDKSSSFDKSFLPMWVEPMNLSQEQLNTLAKKQPDLSLPKNKLFCQEIKDFSKRNDISFYLCSAYALELYSWENIKKGDISKHLSNKLKPLLEFKPTAGKPNSYSYKTIVLTGRSGEGKSLLTNHLVGKDVAQVGHTANSQTQGANLYTSDLLQLNIMDTEGLDGTLPDDSNQNLMDKIRLKTIFYLEIDASLDAIIVTWCPLKNGKSILVKTLEALEKSFGSAILDSCIVMIQGNWRPLAAILNLDIAVPSGRGEIEKNYPDIPIIEYDAKGSVEEQSPLLNEAIKKVKPYKAESFQEHQDIQFLMMAEAFKIKLQELRFEKKLVKGFCESFQLKMLALLKERGHFIEKKKKFGEEFFKLFKGYIYDGQDLSQRRNNFQELMTETNPSILQKFFSHAVLWPFLLGAK